MDTKLEFDLFTRFFFMMNVGNIELLGLLSLGSAS